MLARSTSFTLFSPHSPEECVVRFREAVVPFSSWAWVSPWGARKPLVGEVTLSIIQVRAHSEPPSLHGLELTATLEPADEGTRLDCRINPSATRTVLRTGVLLLMLLFGVCGSVVQVVNASRGGSVWEVWWAVPIVLMSSVGLWVLYHRSHQEAIFLEHVLASWLDAHRKRAGFGSAPIQNP